MIWYLVIHLIGAVIGCLLFIRDFKRLTLGALFFSLMGGPMFVIIALALSDKEIVIYRSKR